VSAPAGGASATLAPGVAGAAPSRSRQGRTPGAVAGSGATTTYDSGAPSTSEVSGRPGSDTPGPAPSGEGPLAKVGGTVDETTRSLGGSLRGVTDSLGRHLDPLSPTVGGTVRKAGDALANTVQGLGSAVAALLGHVPHGPNLPPGR
jgi:hypothetical protein